MFPIPMKPICLMPLISGPRTSFDHDRSVRPVEAGIRAIYKLPTDDTRRRGMILELVTFKTPAGWDRARVLEDAKHTISKWSSNPDLVRKHFGLGIGEDEGTSS